ncbi:MAG: outer membrane beta-barrel protein [Bacteroidales bacterium]|nr:outer membrane beta-barrel protein [Bacteroidales bacterium]
MKTFSRIKFMAIVSIFLFGTSSIMAQSNLTIDVTQVLSNFKFVDSQGVKDKEYKSNYTTAYSIGYQYHAKKGFLARTSIGMRKGGATLIYDAANYDWDLQYANFNLGAGYMYGYGMFKPYLTASGYFGYLLKANQRVNNQDFDILDLEEIEKIDYGIIGSLGTQIKLNDVMSAYTEFSYLMGLHNLETSTDGQESSNVSYMFSVGIVLSINDIIN